MSTTDSTDKPSLSLRQRQMARVSDCLTQEERELTPWEESFLKSIHRSMDSQWRELSPKQLICLESIEEIIKNGRNKAP